jgi:ornithine carbamoyltransferase
MPSPTTIHWPADLLRAADLTRLMLDELLSLAGRMKAEPAGWTAAMAGASLACLYETPTTRAGLSAQAAAHRLGMEPITVAPDDLDRGGGETLADAGRILSGYAAAILVRDLPDRTLGELAGSATVPVINARSPEHHPCQALADLFTLRERFLQLDGLVLAYVGPGGNLARSLLTLGALAGMEVRVAAPADLGPQREDLVAAEVLADLHGGKVSLTTEPAEAVAGADAVATGPWPQPVDPVGRAQLQERLRPYRITAPLFARAKPTAVFLHELPAHRDEEVAAPVLDGPHAVVWQQAANRLPAEQAVIYGLTARSGSSDGH